MKKIFVVLLSTLVLSVSGGSYAAIFTLTDMNSTVQIDNASQSGAFNWFVDGRDQLFQQWFWYRTGTTGGESSINTIGSPTSTTFGSNIVTLNYSNSNLAVQVLYTLVGGTAGSGASDLAETIRIINTSGSPLDLHFFQYSDFDLNQTIGGEIAFLEDSHTIVQSEPGVVLSETVVIPAADHFEIANYATTLNSLNDQNPTTLNGNIAPAAPGDRTWAFQWDVSIPAGGSFLISKDKNIRPVPEPLSLILLGCGMVGLIELRRRIKK